MNKTRFFVPPDLRQVLQARLPGATETDFAALTILIEADKFLNADGTPHPAFVNWVAGILDRRSDGGGAMVVAPPPKPMPQPGAVEIAL